MKARILQFLALAALLCFASAQIRAQAEVQPDQFENPNAVPFSRAANPVAASKTIARDSLPTEASRPVNTNAIAAAAARFLRRAYLGATSLVLFLILQIIVASSSASVQRVFKQRQETVSARVPRRGF